MHRPNLVADALDMAANEIERLRDALQKCEQAREAAEQKQRGHVASGSNERPTKFSDSVVALEDEIQSLSCDAPNEDNERTILLLQSAVRVIRHWQANHDHQVELKRKMEDRYDELLDRISALDMAKNEVSPPSEQSVTAESQLRALRGEKT